MSPVATSTITQPVVAGHETPAKNDNGDKPIGAMDSKSSSSHIPRPPVFHDKLEEREWIKFRLAQAFRIFGKLGYDEGVAGHITVRDPIERDCFWVNPFGKHFTLIQPSDLLLVTHTGHIVKEHSGPSHLLNRAAFMIHSAIHSARPDVLCAAHSHSIYGRSFSTLGIPLDTTTQDSCAFYEDLAVYKTFKGVVLDEEEGQRIAECLGARKAAILQNHGLLVATDSIEATVFFFISLEKCCHVQLMSDAAAAGRRASGVEGGNQTIKIPADEALQTYNTVGTLRAGWFSGLPEFARLEYEEGLRTRSTDVADWGVYKKSLKV